MATTASALLAGRDTNELYELYYLKASSYLLVIFDGWMSRESMLLPL
jgi:hypothetical protein